MKTENQLIEDFYVSQGGKPTVPADIDFYESDWNMLMAVVEQIELIKIPNDDRATYNFQIHKQIAKIWEPFENHKPSIIVAGETKRKAVRKAIIAFIKFQQKST